jgi:hypothetical protein
MKFLVPNYSCLQNPWLGGYRPPDPRSLCSLPSTGFVELPLPPDNIPGYATALNIYLYHYQSLFFLLKVNSDCENSSAFSKSFLEIMCICEVLSEFLSVFTVVAGCWKLPFFSCFVDRRSNNNSRPLKHTTLSVEECAHSLGMCHFHPTVWTRVAAWKIFRSINKHVLRRLFINKHFARWWTSFVYKNRWPKREILTSQHWSQIPK